MMTYNEGPVDKGGFEHLQEERAAMNQKKLFIRPGEAEPLRIERNGPPGLGDRHQPGRRGVLGVCRSEFRTWTKAARSLITCTTKNPKSISS